MCAVAGLTAMLSSKAAISAKPAAPAATANVLGIRKIIITPLVETTSRLSAHGPANR